MATRKIYRERVQSLNEAEVKEGSYVLYWMQSSQRAEQNHALEYAVQQANDLDQLLLVVFGLTDVGPIAYNHPRAR
jgi:deoxyribodipyrimidine photo-lyase